MHRFNGGFRSALTRLIKSEDGHSVPEYYPVVISVVVVAAVAIWFMLGPWIMETWAKIKASSF